MEEFTIEKIQTEEKLIDVMEGCAYWKTSIDEHGSVSLIDVMPRFRPEGFTADICIVQAARVSYGKGTKSVSTDEALIYYLKRHHHATPEEMAEVKFKLVVPIFVARQLLRHRTSSVNEYSARYSEVTDRFWHPKKDEIGLQSTTNKQGTGDEADAMTREEFLQSLDDVERLSYNSYMKDLNNGISRELARVKLPLNIYTEFYWKMNLRNFFHMAWLRMDSHAQFTTQKYAKAMYNMIKKIFPISCSAFERYELNSITLSSLEVEAIRNGTLTINSKNSREIAEWEEKKKKLGLDKKDDVSLFNV